ncbi:hypothetical protein B0H14DRAFT_1138721 [Mycena olivaceomarginata]|nr:hypothetical protein B0H14DRAFT_1138721 [Mycena olivaceomarginata]
MTLRLPLRQLSTGNLASSPPPCSASLSTLASSSAPRATASPHHSSRSVTSFLLGGAHPQFSLLVRKCHILFPQMFFIICNTPELVGKRAQVAPYAPAASRPLRQARALRTPKLRPLRTRSLPTLYRCPRSSLVAFSTRSATSSDQDTNEHNP